MSVSEVRQQAGRPRGAGGPVFDLLAAKLLRPLVRPGTVHRGALIDWLACGDARPIGPGAAPAGYGKTTLLLATQTGRPVDAERWAGAVDRPVRVARPASQRRFP